MSFSNNIRPDRMPGPINGNPVAGLCEKVCIEARKVFDACIKQDTMSNVNVVVGNISPCDPVAPYTYISARSTTSDVCIHTVNIDSIGEKNCSRIQATVSIPIEVVFEDANGGIFSGQATLSITKDVIMRIPDVSVIPYQIVARANAISSEGSYISGSTFSVSFCLTVIFKIVMTVDLLVPTYGYCFIPPCLEYKEEVCEGFFDLPLFPPS